VSVTQKGAVVVLAAVTVGYLWFRSRTHLQAVLDTGSQPGNSAWLGG
jgi:hypothetical protein